MTAPTGVLLMTFGSAVTADDVPAYLASVRAGRAVPPDVIAEFRRRYERIGRSPLIDITMAQGTALQHELDVRHGEGALGVAVGMLHLDPSIASGIAALEQRDAARILAIVLAPQYSPLILAGYERAIEQARAARDALDIQMAGAWHLMPAWIDSLAERVREALALVPEPARARVPIIFTAHSLPRAVVDRDPGYIDQLRDTAAVVARRAALPDERWRFAYQSAGHTPEEWLTPDVKDLLPGLEVQGVADVLIVPLQFIADHLEILYDIDVAASDEALACGIRLRRIELPNTSPTFIRALADVVERDLGAMVGR